jgi:hypothetical protein
MNTTATEEISAPEEHVSLWEDFIDIFYAPREVFARRSAGRWVLLLVIVTVVMALLFYASRGVLQPIFDAEFARAMARNPNITPEQMAGAKKMAGIFGMVGFVVAVPIGIILVGLVLWAVGKIFDSAAPIGVAIMIAVYAQIPRLLQMLLSIVQGFILDASSLRSQYSVTFSPARFLDPDTVSPIVLGLAGRVDLFILWSTVLLAIGLQVLGRVSKAQSYVAALIVWLIGAIPVLLGALSSRG